jgi:hypothetical protein
MYKRCKNIISHGGINRSYRLNWIEPWYGNLPSDNVQIQRNPGVVEPAHGGFTIHP